MTKHKFKPKPLIIAAAIMITSAVSLVSVNAATQGAVVKFLMGGEEREGEYEDYVDGDGFRHISFEAVLPIDEENFAVIIDIEAPKQESVRVITKETDPEFMEKLQLYVEAYKKVSEYPDNEYPILDPADFGLIIKDSEHCSYHIKIKDDQHMTISSGSLGDKFMHVGNADGHPSEVSSEFKYDHKNGTKTYTETFYYYVGKE